MAAVVLALERQAALGLVRDARVGVLPVGEVLAAAQAAHGRARGEVHGVGEGDDALQVDVVRRRGVPPRVVPPRSRIPGVGLVVEAPALDAGGVAGASGEVAIAAEGVGLGFRRGKEWEQEGEEEGGPHGDG